MAVALEEALSQLRADPEHPVTTEVDGLVIEMRVQRKPTAGDIFRALGPWEGETEEELLALLREARKEVELLRLLARGEREIAQGGGHSLDSVLREADALLEADP